MLVVLCHCGCMSALSLLALSTAGLLILLTFGPSGPPATSPYTLDDHVKNHESRPSSAPITNKLYNPHPYPELKELP